MTENPDQDAWTFICELYGLPGVKEACIALQERLGLSVTTLLTLIWAGETGRGMIGAEALDTALGSVHLWHGEVTRTLRQVRRQLGPNSDDMSSQHQELKGLVQHAELEAERLEQQVLLRDLALPVDAVESGDWPDAVCNAAAYVRRFVPEPEPQSISELGLILSAALPDPDGPHLTAVLARYWTEG